MNPTGHSLVTVGWPLAVSLLVLVALATALAWRFLPEHWTTIPWAAVRATVQLGVLSLILALVVGHWWGVALFLTGMSLIAAHTAQGRITAARKDTPRLPQWQRTLLTALPVAVPPILLVGTLALVGVVPAEGIVVLPLTGIFIGNAMGITGLVGRRVNEELHARAGEVDAALALGFLPQTARSFIAAPAASAALIPTLDATKTVGMVTIPGAFVGMVLGGASPIQAGAMQLFVMLGILTLALVALVVTTALVVRRLI